MTDDIDDLRKTFAAVEENMKGFFERWEGCESDLVKNGNVSSMMSCITEMTLYAGASRSRVLQSLFVLKKLGEMNPSVFVPKSGVVNPMTEDAVKLLQKYATALASHIHGVTREDDKSDDLVVLAISYHNKFDALVAESGRDAN